jgi:serine/threonine protein kinase
MSNVIVANKYRLTKKIGEGSFGKIYLATYKDNKERLDEKSSTSVITSDVFAIKIMTSNNERYIINELSIYEKIKGIKNVPSLYESGKEGKYNYMVMELLEQSLEDLRKSYGEQMSLKVVIHLSLQMLIIIEQIHEKGIIHRDLKPANFLLKTNESNISEIYLIDFGLARCFLDDKQRHYSLITNEDIVGTRRYMSINTHQGISSSRRDDIESFVYIMMFLYYGGLPWQNQKSVKDVVTIKEESKWSMEVVGEFILILIYARNLGFTDKPNYIYIRNVLNNLASV